MQEIDLLKQLFDEKIVKILGVFAKHPERRFYLTEITKITKVNVSTTFRILNKLVEKEFIKSMVIGRTRFYQLNNNEKTQRVVKILKYGGETATSTTPLNEFLEKIKTVGRVKKVILKSKDSSKATLILVGDFIPVDRVQRIINEIKSNKEYQIEFVELSQRQFEALYNITEFKRLGKVLYEADTK
jgi:DNA-binding MarR family transcriptional regulator